MSFWIAATCLAMLVLVPFVLPALSSTVLAPTAHAWSRRERITLLLVAVLLVVVAALVYRHLGAASDVRIYRELQAMPAEAMTPESPQWQSLLVRIAARSAERPANHGYLRLLAEDAAAREDWAAANGYYQQLAELSGHDPDVEALWLTARFMAANRQIDETLRQDMEALLSLDPAQASVRGMLGMDAFAKAQYGEAISHWQQALKHLPPNDPVAAMLKQGVTRARLALGESLPVLRIEVPSPGLADPLPADSTVFVFVSLEGQRMPLAARKLALSQLPLVLELGEADVLGGQSWPVQAGRLRVSARLVPAGAVGGEVLWEAASDWQPAPVGDATVVLSPVTPQAAQKSR